MARADLLRQLFECYKRQDADGFRSAAKDIIEEERRKHHPVLAAELLRILNNGAVPETQAGAGLVRFEPPPTDGERRSALLTVMNPTRRLADLVLDGTTQDVVDRIMTEFRSWEVLESNGLTPVRRILFCGPSGCGKTATAEAVAGELGLPLVYVRFDGVVSSLLGETAANIRKVFDYARRGQWVLFFDEFDAIGRSRDDATEHGEIKRVVNSFLQILDGFDGRSLIIASTNFEQALDPAIWRRFDEVVRFERPSVTQVRELLGRRLIVLKARRSEIDNLVRLLSGSTYADVQRVVDDIRRICALEGRSQLQAADVDQATVRHEYRMSVMRKVLKGSAPPTVDRD